MKFLYVNILQKNKRCSIINNIFPIFSRFKSEIMKYLNVAEKNDAAKNIALQLSRGTSNRREGLSKYNKIYEFEADVLGNKSKMVMTSVSGHLLSYEFDSTYKNWKMCNPLVLFEANVSKHCHESYDNIKKTLEREVRSCQGLIIWTDCDREGENIGFEIIDVCTAVRSDLRIYRAKFSEITAVSVRRALHNLEQPNKNISDAVDVRQQLDLRIGAAFTRFQTLRLQKVFPTLLAESMISYGSCQFPTLGFVVERYRAVENFRSEPFWKLKVNHTMNNLSVDYAWSRVRLFDQDSCQVFHDICLENPQAKVTDVKTKPKSKWRPLPLDTVELEKFASRKLNINAMTTMKIAEKLYTQGLISYPRTETNEFPKEINLGQLVEMQTGDPNWGTFAQNIIDSGGPTPRQGNKSDKAHPPIHPTKYTRDLSGNEQKVYEFIVRSFLACCSKDAQGQETVVTIDVANEVFSASGLMITARNYLDVYPYDKWSSKEIHVYENGQTFMPTSIDMLDGNTSPPNLLTEADLIALMEKHGIGTDATHAEHIEKIKSRTYVALPDAVHFVPKFLGMGLVEGYDAMGLNISKPNLRAQLEADLKDICEGRKHHEVVLAEQIAKYKEVYITATAEANKIDSALAARFEQQPVEYTPSFESLPNMTPALKCPKCGSDMVVKQKKNNADGYFISCTSYPRCTNAIWFNSLAKSIQVLPDTCPTCGPNYKKLKFEWRNNSISHIYPPPHTTCIGGCDATFLELLKINLSSVKSSSRIARSNSTNSYTTSNGNIARSFTNSSIDSAYSASNNIPNGSYNSATNSNHPRQIEPSTVNRMNYPRPQASSNHGWYSEPTFPRDDYPSNDDNVMCNCGVPGKKLTVRKEGPNKGRQFYGCPKDLNERCTFFLWVDGQTNAEWGGQERITSAARGRGRDGRGLARSASVGESRTRKCGLCRQEGHTRNRCPNNTDAQ